MANHRSESEWIDLITKCRQSGLSDFEWCRRNGISKSTFYKAVARIRNASVKLPERSTESDSYDLTSSLRQDVVPIRIIPESTDLDSLDMSYDAAPKYQMMLSYGNIKVQFTNDASSAIIKHTIQALGDLS